MSHSDLFNRLTVKPLRWLLALGSVFSGSLSTAQAQCSLTCNDGLQISLDATGQVLITPQLIAPNAAASCPGTLQLKLFTPQGLLIPGNTLNCDHIGQAITAQVKHLTSGNSCEGTLEVRDFLPPIVTCPDKFVFCNQDPSPANLGLPAMTDNCTPVGNLTYYYFDNAESLDCGTLQNGVPVTKRIDRTWSVEDAYGNPKECLQRIWIKHITLANVTFPPNLDGLVNPSLNCGQDPNDLALAGQPTVEGVPVENSPDCEFGVTFSDQVIGICPPAGYSVLRTWTAVDFCSGQIVNRLQIIRVEDKTPPAIAALPDLTVGTDGFLCSGTVEFPPAEVNDDCSAVTVVPSWSFGSGFGPFPGVPAGTHLVTYTATDACNNSATTTFSVTVIDAGPPAAICASGIQVSLSAGGTGSVNAAVVDGGSFDNCSPVVLDIGRNDSVFTPSIPVSCVDLGTPLLLTLRVTDAAGLENFCEAEVTVRDFLKPQIQCPANLTLTCLQDPYDLQLTGMATASDNCLLQGIEFTDISNLSACNTGTLTRTWKATDAGGNSKTCVQQIIVQAVNTVNVAFPPDVTVSACSDPAAVLPPATGEPLTGGTHCTPLSVTYLDQVFDDAPGTACYTILRAWKVVDFCIYDPNNDSLGVWEQIQKIDIVDDMPPAMVLPADMTLNADFPDCTARVTLPDIVATDCTGPVAVAHDAVYADAPGANASGFYPPGTHQVVFTAADTCGNVAQQTLTITVADLMPPKAVCMTGLNLELDTSGAASLDPAALDGGSSDFCTPAGSLALVVQPNAFTCQSPDTQLVVLTVTDAAGNSAACSATVTLTDPFGACQPPPPPDYQVEGNIRLETGKPVAEIPVTLSGDGFTAVAECAADGHYVFEDVPAGNYYTLRPENNAKWLNGLTTFDLVLITKHILGLDTLDTPFQLIAADANRSGTVTTFDIVQFRKVILGLADTVPGNTSWRFVDASYVFPDPANPFGAVFPEKITAGNLTGNQAQRDFTAVKLGDINNSADAVDPRHAPDTLLLGVSVVPSQTAIEVRLENWPLLEGFQFELAPLVPGMVIDSIRPARPGILDAGHTALRPDGSLAVSWEKKEVALPEGDDPLLFTLYVSGGALPESGAVFRLNPERLFPEAYRTVEDLPAVLSLRPGSGRGGNGPFEVLSVQPNPFSGETYLHFYLPEPAGISLWVTDLSGRVVLKKQAPYPAGYGAWRISGDELPVAGIYVFSLRAAALPVRSGKLVRLENR